MREMGDSGEGGGGSFSGVRDMRQSISTSSAYVASGTLVSVSAKTRKAMAADKTLLSWGSHNSCLIWTVGDNMPSTTSLAESTTSLSHWGGWDKDLESFSAPQRTLFVTRLLDKDQYFGPSL